MELTHTFTVPATLEDTWAAFNDIESVAGCFPGATVTSVEGDEFKGSCKVKLGPISLVYSGVGKFLEKDADAHRFVVDAKGKDKRGNGTAGAVVTATFASPSPTSTAVTVVTDLAITGKPAQFGRGVIQDVSDKLLQAFVTCLESKVGAPAPVPTAAAPAVDDTGPAEVGSTGRPSGEEVPVGGPASGPGKHLADDDAAAAVSASAAAPQVAASPSAAAPQAAASPSAAAPQAAASAEQNDALDLGATVLPILLKTYWKQAAGAVLALLVLRRLLRRR